MPSKRKSKGEELQLWENSRYIPLTPTQDGRSAKSYTLKLLLFHVGRPRTVFHVNMVIDEDMKAVVKVIAGSSDP